MAVALNPCRAPPGDTYADCSRGRRLAVVPHMKLLPSALLLSAVLSLTASADAVKDREGAVRNDKATMENDARWLYNDIDAGFAAGEIPEMLGLDLRNWQFRESSTWRGARRVIGWRR